MAKSHAIARQPDPVLRPVPLAKLAAPRHGRVRWVWRGFLAAGALTLLTSQWKTGKTTLLSVLLARLRTGGKLASLSVCRGWAIVVSEENGDHWLSRGQRLKFGPGARFLCRPFRRQPSAEQWESLIDSLLCTGRRQPPNLVVIDTLPSLLPAGSEQSADAMQAALRPLERLTAEGVAVLLLHHPRKGQSLAGQSARGSGALSAIVDILIEMRTVGRGERDDRRRSLCAWSRYDETPRQLIVELSPEGDDYAVVAEELDDNLERGLLLLCDMLRLSGRQLTRDNLLECWPKHCTPHAGTLWRWLEAGMSRGLIVSEGKGVRGNPYRYTLPGLNVPWDPTPAEVLGW